ncbi:MAG TPA: STAS domain-containing protein [Nocardioides sp.]|uniref:STAS domain-containing protein n=1 Tax=Nocardioides sp. TaxID=35761 RepID=UPI002D7F066F|nr:STAS domain-containing protein [Nocardioides sp.]HET6653902.1 STAS domain-containing protein [Nocardioides sp.]
MTARRYEVGRWLVIEAQGEIDLMTAPLLSRLVDGVSSHLVFDLSRVTFIDARGLGLLAVTRAKLNGAHGSMSVAGPTPQTRKLLALTGLDRVVEVYDSLGEALWGHASCS